MYNVYQSTLREKLRENYLLGITIVHYSDGSLQLYRGYFFV